MASLTVTPLQGIARIQPGDDLATLLTAAVIDNGVHPKPGDVLVIAQKIISKAENCYRQLSTVTPSSDALDLAEKTAKDPRLVELVLQESSQIIRAVPGVLIVRHRNGHVMANAGIDASNLSAEHGDDWVLLLPVDADASAAKLRRQLHSALGLDVGVVISDSFGRPWRHGVTNVAIGVSGPPALLDKRNETDMAGRTLRVTQVAVGDLLASSAGLVMGEGNEAVPAAWISGLPKDYQRSSDKDNASRSLLRGTGEDLFQ